MRARELKMLFYKSWLETRWAFVVALLVLLAFSMWSVLRFPASVQGGLHDLRAHQHPNAAVRGIAAYTQVEIFAKLALLWTIFSVMLGTGGLLKERRLGTAAFLLSLPVTRRRLVAARCAVSVAEAACLALASYAIVPLALPLVHETYSLGLALRYAGILVVAGVSFVTYGILISVVLDGGNWPAIIGASTAFLTLAVSQLVAAFQPFGPFAVLSGETYFRLGILPWTGMSIGVAIATVILASALWIVKWQDF